MMQEDQKFLAPDMVLRRFAEKTGAPIADLQGTAQTRYISRLRHEAAWLLRHLTVASTAQIGELLGGRSPATINEGIDRVTLRAADEPDYRHQLADLRKAIIAAIPAPAPNGSSVRVTAAMGVLADRTLSDADARQAALILLRSVEPRI